MNPRADAIAAVRSQLGLSNTPSDWTYDERVAYNKALAAYIAAHASQFPPQDVATAADIQAQAVSPLADTGTIADIKAFGSAFADELEAAGTKVASVGNGVLDSVNLTGKLLPIVTIAAIGLLLWYGYEQVKNAPQRL